MYAGSTNNAPRLLGLMLVLILATTQPCKAWNAPFPSVVLPRGEQRTTQLFASSTAASLFSNEQSRRQESDGRFLDPLDRFEPNSNNSRGGAPTRREPKKQPQRRGADDKKAWQLALSNATTMHDQMVLLREQTEAAIAGRRLPTTAERASAVVRAMHEADRVPPTLSYNAVLKAWKSYATRVRNNPLDWEVAVAECQALLTEMAARQAADVVSYTTLIAVLALRDWEPETAHRAEGVFYEMQRHADNTGNEKVAPNARTRNAVLRAWANADDLGHAVRLLADWEDDPASNVQLTTASYATL